VEAMEGWEAQGLERPDQLEDPASVRASIPAAAPPRQAETATTETEKVGGPENEQAIEEPGVERERARETARQVEV
jgi:hypothetical protein